MLKRKTCSAANATEAARACTTAHGAQLAAVAEQCLLMRRAKMTMPTKAEWIAEQFIQYCYDHRMICNGDMLVEAMEDGDLYSRFCRDNGIEED